MILNIQEKKQFHKIYLFLFLTISILVMVGVYYGFKQYNMERIEDVYQKKLSYGWKVNESCSVLDFLGFGVPEYLPSNKYLYSCDKKQNIQFNSINAHIKFSAIGVDDKVNELNLTGSFKPKSENTIDNDELNLFDTIFAEMSYELIYFSTGTMLDDNEKNQFAKTRKNTGSMVIKRDTVNIIITIIESKKFGRSYILSINGKPFDLKS